MATFTPKTLISSALSLAAFASLVIGFNSYYMPRAEADEIIGKVQRQQQVDRVETDLTVIELEMKFLEESLEDDPDNARAKKRLEYLEKRLLVLEEYQLELQRGD